MKSMLRIDFDFKLLNWKFTKSYINFHDETHEKLKLVINNNNPTIEYCKR